MPQPSGNESRARARLEDVAAAAGVSKSTVSRVLSDDPTLSVRADTRERVRALAQELGYRPHPVARALAVPATGALTLLVPNLSNPAYVEIIRGAYRRARERGYVLLCAEDFEDQEADEAFTELVDGGRVDGLLIASARPENRLLDALERHWVPHVFVNRSVPGARANVTLDVARASRLAYEYLAGLGHRTIGHVAGPHDVQSARGREEAFLAAAADHGHGEPPVARGAFTPSGGAEAAERLLAEHPEVTAVFTSSLAQAIGLLHVARERGRAVPADLSVIAYDELPVAEYLDPPVTTVAMPLSELGAAAVEILVELLDGREVRSQVLGEEPTVVERESTAPPP
jgi:LacI family transcriptional regulator, galactose operon repressor